MSFLRRRSVARPTGAFQHTSLHTTMQRTRGPRKRPPVHGSAILLVEEARTRSLFQCRKRLYCTAPDVLYKSGHQRLCGKVLTEQLRRHVPFGHRRPARRLPSPSTARPAVRTDGIRSSSMTISIPATRRRDLGVEHAVGSRDRHRHLAADVDQFPRSDACRRGQRATPAME